MSADTALALLIVGLVAYLVGRQHGQRRPGRAGRWACRTYGGPGDEATILLTFQVLGGAAPYPPPARAVLGPVMVGLN